MIRLYPDKVLRTKCRVVETFDDELRILVDSMVEEMYASNGVGLASTQLGDDRRVVVIDSTCGERNDTLHVLVNPKIMKGGRKIPSREGCLSIPNAEFEIMRYEAVKIEYQRPDGTSDDIILQDREAFIAQHECDHLDGILIVDRLPRNAAAKFAREYRRQ